jgi:general secretion pathway protein G
MTQPGSVGSITLALVLVVGVSMPAFAGADYDDSAEAWATRLDLETAGRILETYHERHPELPPPAEWIALDEFCNDLPRMYASRLPRRDGWGNRLLVGSLDEELALVSKGQNGVAETIDRNREGSDDDDSPGRGDRPADHDDMILVVGERVENGPRTLLSRQRRTLADMRSIATAVESFAIDNDVYPLQGGGLRTLDGSRPDVEPLYIRTLPLEDGWGNPYLYWSDSLTYVLVSAGADGVFEPRWRELAPLEAIQPGPTKDPNADVVFANGQFVEWPGDGYP